METKVFGRVMRQKGAVTKMIAGGEMETEEDVLFLGMRAVADRCVGWWEWSSDQDVLRWLWHFPRLPRAISRAWISPLGPCLLRLLSLFHWNTAYSGSLTDRNHLGFSLYENYLKDLAPSFNMNIKNYKKLDIYPYYLYPESSQRMVLYFLPCLLTNIRAY